MKSNNKGFAISIMLYAMVLLIVTIFYIILAIVKNRYNTSEELVDKAVTFMEENDHYAAASDKVAPLIVFSHNSITLGDSVSSSNFKIFVYDQNIDPKKITAKTGSDSTVSLNCTPNEQGHSVYQCSPKNVVSIPNASGYIDLIISATDSNGNVTTKTRRIYKAKAPTCTVSVIDEKTCNQFVHSCTKLASTTSGGVTKYKLYQGDYAIYQISCTSNSGVDAFFNAGDFASSSTGSLVDFKITTERTSTSTVIKIIVRGANTSDATTLKVNGGDAGIIKICDSYGGSDSTSNCSDVQLPLINVVQPTATH